MDFCQLCDDVRECPHAQEADGDVHVTAPGELRVVLFGPPRADGRGGDLGEEAGRDPQPLRGLPRSREQGSLPR